MQLAIALGVLAVLLVAGGAAAATGINNKRGLVLGRERADGVHPSLVQLLNDWEVEGTHKIEVAGGPGWSPPGGLRTNPADQLAAFNAGLSAASSLQDSAHGRGAALDVWPAGFNPHRGFDDAEQLPDAEALFYVFGRWAEQRGFTWGGRWSTPDLPHVELPSWRSLPYPPRYGGVA